MRVKFGCVLAIVASSIISAPIQAKVPLREVSAIDDHLMAVGIADEIRKKCDGINARMIKALSVLQGLKSYARDLGYTNDEIDDYVTSNAEKKRMRAKAEAWLAARGVDGNDTGDLCRFGREQIAVGGKIGELLR